MEMAGLVKRSIPQTLSHLANSTCIQQLILIGCEDDGWRNIPITLITLESVPGGTAKSKREVPFPPHSRKLPRSIRLRQFHVIDHQHIRRRLLRR